MDFITANKLKESIKFDYYLNIVCVRVCVIYKIVLDVEILCTIAHEQKSLITQMISYT